MRARLQGPQQSTIQGPNDILIRELCAMRRAVEVQVQISQGLADILYKGMLPLVAQANEKGDEMLAARDELRSMMQDLRAAADQVTGALRDAPR